MIPPPPSSTLFPYTTLFRSDFGSATAAYYREKVLAPFFAYYLKGRGAPPSSEALTFRTGVNEKNGASTFSDRKSTRLNSSHTVISYAVFCLKKKIKNTQAYE